MFDINLWAVLAAALASMVLGTLWYGPLFGKPWMKMVGMTKADAEKAKKDGMGKTYLLMFVSSFVLAFVLAHVIQAFGAETWQMGLAAGFWTWLGFIATKSMGGQLWRKDSWNLYYLNNGYELLNLLIAGLILTLWA